MIRIRSFLPGFSLALAASCSSSAPPPETSAPTVPQPPSDLTAVSLGVTIDARGDRGEPRLVRAVVPRKTSLGGMTGEQAARDHLAALRPLWFKHQKAAPLEARSSQIFRSGSSIHRFQQQINGIDVHQGELRVMVNRDGSLNAVSGVMRPNAARTSFRSAASEAVDAALDAIYGTGRARPAILPGEPDAGSFIDLKVEDTPEFRVPLARVKRELLPEGGSLLPVHVVELRAEKYGLDNDVTTVGRRIIVADGDLRVVRNINLQHSDAFVYRAFADTTGTRNPTDGALESYNPHPTGTPDGSVPGPGSYNLVVMEAFNGPRDPWLPSNATTTRGNNVDAFADLTEPLGIFNDGTDIRPEVRAGRTLNYRYDLAAEPLSSPNQSKAAAVNVFFVTNWLHDWYYDSGFTEATGNAQRSNLGRGGIQNDPLIASAQAGALAGARDNALMFTPSDGSSPMMHMFLWSGASTSSLRAGDSSPRTEIFVNSPRQFEVTGEVVLSAETADGGATACTPVTDAVAGKIAFFEFTGACSSLTAITNLKLARAIGAIASIKLPGEGIQQLNGSPIANLPGVVIGPEDGDALKATLPTTATITRETSLEKDGDLDNAIVAHEWGHYLHHRLAVCEVTNQCGAMSEGWGDFVALHMMLRDTDDRSGTYSEGVYASSAGGLAAFGFQDPGYFGLRRFPYSIDRAKNDLSFRHVGDDAQLPDMPLNPGPAAQTNAEVHNAGEVWAAQLWEVYNVLLDAHPFAEARRRMSDYVVAGLLLTPPEATFTEARDALLAATGGLDGDDMILMAAAFAGRGAGTCAVSPARDSVDFAGVVESGTLAARIETSAATLTDDGVSCDRDGYLDPGESGTLHITVANSGIIAAEDVTVRATTSSAGVTLGRPVNVGLIAPFSQVDIAIPVRLAASAPTNSALDIVVNIDGEAGCNTRHLEVELHQRMGVDETAGVSRSDDVETGIVAWTPTGEGAADLWARVPDRTGHVLFAANADFLSDTQLVSPVLQAGTEPLIVSFDHAFDLEAFPEFPDSFFDGYVLEVSSDGGATWRDVTEVGVDPDYPATITTVNDLGNPLAGRDAFSNVNPSFPNTDRLTLDFGTQFAGQPVQLRFRLGTDFCCTGQGPLKGLVVDNIAVSGITNTPFPGLAAEPSRCVGGVSARIESGVTAVRANPRASLGNVSLPPATTD